jgi:hypothetical protein
LPKHIATHQHDLPNQSTLSHNRSKPYLKPSNTLSDGCSL